MPVYQVLTDRTLANSTAITPTTLIHIVTTGDTSQGNPAGSSYKAELQQLSAIFSGGSISGDYLPLTGGTVSGDTEILDSTGTIRAIDTRTRELVDSNDISSVDWEFRTLFDTNGANSVDYEFKELNDSTGINSADWGYRILVDNLNNTSLNWDSTKRYLVDTSGVQTSVDWGNRRMYDSGGTQSLFWGNRRMYDSGGTQSLFWDVRRFYDTSGLTSINYANRTLIRSGTTISFDWENGILTGQTNIQSSTISATTYQNLPVSGLTEGTNISLANNNSNYTISVTGMTGGISIDPYFNSGSGSTITWNVSGQSTNYQATLTATTTLNLTNVRNGDYGTIILTQDSVGGRTISLGTINGASATHRVVNGGGGSVVLTSNANAIDILTFTYNGSTMFWTVGNDYT
jgi:hypothetical protein